MLEENNMYTTRPHLITIFKINIIIKQHGLNAAVTYGKIHTENSITWSTFQHTQRIRTAATTSCTYCSWRQPPKTGTVLRLLAVLALDLHYRTRGTHAHTHLSYTFSVYDWIIIIQRLPRRTSLNDDVIQLLQDLIAQTTWHCIVYIYSTH